MYSVAPRLRSIGHGDDIQYPLLSRDIGWLFVASNVFNSAWIFTFVWGTTPAIWISTVFIASLEGCLIAIYLRADIWKARRDTFLEFLCVDVAFSTYLGWVTVATIINITITLTRSGWDGEPLNHAFYPSAMLSVAAVLALLTLATRLDICYPAIFCWATVAIVVRIRLPASYIHAGVDRSLSLSLSLIAGRRHPQPRTQSASPLVGVVGSLTFEAVLL